MKALNHVRAEDQLPDPAVVSADPLGAGQMVDTRYATDKQATGVMRLELSQRDGTLFVRAFGAGRYEIGATSYGATVNVMTFSARYDSEFLVTILGGQRRADNPDARHVQPIHRLRASYFQRDHFYLP